MDTFLNLVIAGFGFLVLIFIFLFFTTYLPQKVRSRRLSSVAKEFQLMFDSNASGWKWLIDNKNYNYKRNLIKGVINNRSIEIFDSYKHVDPSIPIGSIGAQTVIRRRTIFVIDGVEKEVKSEYPLRFPSISKVRETISNLKSL